ncbi:killer cell lectin-like receptor subfamily B member 1B allele A [Carettochelys insculpta]|uniref:killer cell lectin-like receptor subfamily B member 1B allele A n=1 Tax=Carettochelys insculpta TaxID=44489 RepID=UPI003EBC0336
MAGEITYADLNLPGARSSSRPPQPSQHFSSSPCPRWHRIAAGVGWAGNIILTIAVIVMGAWVSQLHGSCEGGTRGTLSTPGNSEIRLAGSAECRSCLEEFRSHLKPVLCQPHSFPEGAGCRLCPRDWLLRGEQCYWLSKESKDWAGSRTDCEGKSSRLLVLRSQEELDSLQNVTHGSSYFWVGLRLAPAQGRWAWVDGSPLEPERFSISGSAATNSCGCVKGSRLQSETCDAEFKWLCQKDAVVI